MRSRKKALNWAMISLILGLAWPTMLEQLMQTAVQYVDTAMVGALGTHATAAVGATGTVNWLLSSTISALSIGLLAYIARACGAKELQNARRASAQGVLLTLVTGTVLTVVVLGLSGRIPVWMQVDPRIVPLARDYFFILYTPMLARTAIIIFGTILRAAGDTKTPMKVGLTVNVINVVLNFLLIYEGRTAQLFGRSIYLPGAGWGVLGAAAASAVAFGVGGVYITVVLWKHPLVSPKGCSIRPDGHILRPCMEVALPNMLQRFGTSLGYVAFASMINSLGEVATAAHTIANTVESAFYIPGYGMQTAAATLAGNAYGAMDKKKMQELANLFLPIEVLLMTVSGGALFFTARSLVGLFSASAAVITLGATVLRMVAVSEPFYGFSIIMEGMMQGVGKTKETFAYNIIGMWGVRIIGTFLCTQLLGLGLISAWACMIAHNLLLFVLFLRIYRKKTWIPAC